MDELAPFFRREAERLRRKRAVRRVLQRLQMGVQQVQGPPISRCKHPATVGLDRQTMPVPGERDPADHRIASTSTTHFMRNGQHSDRRGGRLAPRARHRAPAARTRVRPPHQQPAHRGRPSLHLGEPPHPLQGGSVQQRSRPRAQANHLRADGHCETLNA
jgi:hypothetical protein